MRRSTAKASPGSPPLIENVQSSGRSDIPHQNATIPIATSGSLLLGYLTPFHAGEKIITTPQDFESSLRLFSNAMSPQVHHKLGLLTWDTRGQLVGVGRSSGNPYFLGCLFGVLSWANSSEKQAW